MTIPPLIPVMALNADSEASKPKTCFISFTSDLKSKYISVVELMLKSSSTSYAALAAKTDQTQNLSSVFSFVSIFINLNTL